MRKLAIIWMITQIVLVSTVKVEAADNSDRMWQDESIYYIQVDRFMNGETDQHVDYNDPSAYHGGDLQGIIDQLEYIKEMGFTAIQLSPIMANTDQGYHGYAIEDFRAVEEHFGTMEDAARLVQEAHALDIEVIFDFVVSHVSTEHPWVSERAKDDWFVDGEGSDHPWQQGLAELNLSNTEVRQYLIDTAKMWVKKTDVDGFRLDAKQTTAPVFYENFSKEVRSVKEDLFIYASHQLSPELISEKKINGFYDLEFQKKMTEAFQSAGSSLENLYDIWEENRTAYESSYHFVHSTDPIKGTRFTHQTVMNNQNPITRWKLALTYLFTAPGVPLVKFGTEVPLDDGGELGSIPMMNFKAGDEELTHRLEKLISIREQFPALTRGDFEELHNEDGFAIFKRSYEGQSMIIAINNSEETKVADIEAIPEDHQLRGLLKDGIIRQQRNGTYKIGMERETADVFVIEPNQGYNWLFIGFVGGVLGLFVLAVTLISIKNRKTGT